MKKWTNAELVELNITETAHGGIDGTIEISKDGQGFNNDLFDGKDSDGDGLYGYGGIIIIDNRTPSGNENSNS